MSAGTAGSSVWVKLLPGADGFGLWAITDAGPSFFEHPEVQDWISSANAICTARAEVASVSVVPASTSPMAADSMTIAGAASAQASSAALPLCVLNGRVAGLIGLTAEDASQQWPIAKLQQWIELATLKGLVHLWLLSNSGSAITGAALRTVPSLRPGDRGVVVPWRSPPGQSVATGPAMSIGIDAAWLLAGESGAQVFVFEMVREMTRRPEVARVVCLSETGAVPRAIASLPNVSGASWADVGAGRLPRLDILHRPYQPGTDVDYRRYHAAARAVAITVLDFIAYDNPAYHESAEAWRHYQQLFDAQVALADCVFAISEHVGSRLQRQFAHQLSGPVHSVLLGTDHLTAESAGAPAPGLDPALATLDGRSFLLVLGNDFEHKNRDFAVKVFADMCGRGYDGHLVLAGFHLDGGSSFRHELTGAGAHADRIIRVGSVPGDQKTWLLSRAQAVLYPTSSEGFGLIPFEAAALGTPTAFVRFGPLRETLRDVAACEGWQVRPFADHVFTLLANPALQLEQIRVTSAALTWQRCVDHILAGYRHVLSDSASWQTERRALEPERFWGQVSQGLGTLVSRAKRKLRRSPLRDG